VADFGLSNFLEERGFFTTDCGTQMYKVREKIIPVLHCLGLRRALEKKGLLTYFNLGGLGS